MSILVDTTPNYLPNITRKGNKNTSQTLSTPTSPLNNKETLDTLSLPQLFHWHIFLLMYATPESDIETSTNSIQTQFDVAHIYEDNGRHLITIPKKRLLWLWKQYHLAINTPHSLKPPTQSFETEIVWLYQRYKYRIPKNDPLKRAQYTIPTSILDFTITTFNINHSSHPQLHVPHNSPNSTHHSLGI